MNYLYVILLLATTGVMAKPVVAQNAAATSVMTFVVSSDGHTVNQRSINETEQTEHHSLSLSTDSQSGSSQTSTSEDGRTTESTFNFGSTASSIVLENSQTTRELDIEFREEFDFNEVVIINNTSTGYSF